MIYTDMTNKAMKIAYQAHKDQVDKAGVPYIFHPYHLAEQMDNETRVCIAMLHDVVEDTPITIEQLQKDFPQEVTDALQLLTHEKDTDYFDYIEKIGTNGNAVFVKLADLIHNMTEARLTEIKALEQKQLRLQKYAKAFGMLVGVIEEHYSIEKAEQDLFQRLMQEYQNN